MNVLKHFSSSCAPNVIENMILISPLGKSYLVVSWGRYVSSIQNVVDYQTETPGKSLFCRMINILCLSTWFLVVHEITF